MLSRLRKWKNSITNRFTRSNPPDSQILPYIRPSPFPEPSLDQSALETLPCELLWKLFEYAPECVFSIRLSSRMLRYRVDTFATQSKTILLAYWIGFLPNSIDINIMSGRENLFELRLKFRLPLTNLQQIKRNPYGGQKGTTFSLMYGFNLLDTVKDSLGKAVGMIEIVDDSISSSNTIVSIMSKMLVGFQFRQLKISPENFSSGYCKFILDTIDLYKIEKLTISACIVSISEPVNFLLKLSAHIRALCIHQYYPEGLTANNFLFGVRNADWAPIFIEMLSTNKMLDKLSIINKIFPAYLDMQAADLLKERLPFLGKNIWFSASCECFLERMEYMENDFVIQADGAEVLSFDRTLRIKHYSRRDEEF